MTPKAVILTIGPWHEKPWWWGYIERSLRDCNVKYVRIITSGGEKEADLLLRHLPRISFDIIKVLNKYKPRYVFTFECGVASFLVSALQTFGFMPLVRHVILQFIMREKNESIGSKLKYLFMRFIFLSIDQAICSSKSEALYYRKIFGWKDRKVAFVPFHTDPEFLALVGEESEDEQYILTAGRTFRDYETFLEAIRDIACKVIVVASPWNISMKKVPANVTFKYDISMEHLIELIRHAAIVVVPLEDRKISTGQSVFLQAMAMGKSVIATKTAGTVDYIDHLKNGILVPPGDSRKMQEMIRFLLYKGSQRRIIGRNAKTKVAEFYLPEHYFKNVSKILCGKKDNKYTTGIWKTKL